MRSYLTNRQQRVRVNSKFSNWENIVAGVPESSILGSLLFNAPLSELFLFVSYLHLSNYAADKTLHTFGYNLKEIKNILRFDSELVSKLFEENYMVRNADVILCALVRTRKTKYLSVTISSFIKAMKKILEIPIDNNLTFESH